MATLSVATWIGNAAAVLSGRFGAISQRAKEKEIRDFCISSRCS
jgi:hypothetical protein